MRAIVSRHAAGMQNVRRGVVMAPVATSLPGWGGDTDHGGCHGGPGKHPAAAATGTRGDSSGHVITRMTYPRGRRAQTAALAMVNACVITVSAP